MALDPTSLRKLQLLELKILLELKRVCEKHDIQYFLMGGTLLGAVRHQGFIPWDDDIDVGMMRSEYNRFIRICKSELSKDFFFQIFDTDNTYANAFAKIRLNGTEYPEPANMDTLLHKGISIDIFPFDCISNNKYIREFHKFILAGLSGISRIKFGYVVNFSTLKKKLLYIFSLTLHKVHIVKLSDLIFTIYNYRKTNYYINASLYYFPSEIFEGYTELEFESIKFPAPSGYKKYLEHAYGDYMRLPPESKRKSHSSYTPFFGEYANINSIEDILKQANDFATPGDNLCKR